MLMKVMPDLKISVSAIVLIAFTLMGGLQILNFALLQWLGEGMIQQIALLDLCSF